MNKYFHKLLKTCFSSLVITVAFVIAVISTFSSCNIFSSKNSRSLIALKKAFKNERPFESRISGFDYAPVKNTRGNNKGNIDNTNFTYAREIAFQDLSENPSDEDLHAVGRIFLAEKEFDDAIEQFENALKLSPNNAKLHNDLGSAFLEKAKNNDNNLKLLANSLEEFSKAIELDKTSKEAYFNKALSIQLMNLPNQTKEAWQEYLKIDNSTDWSKEAQRSLQNLETVKKTNQTKDEIRSEFLKAFQNDDKETAWKTLSRNREIVKGKLISQQLAFLFIEAKSNNDDIKAKDYLNALSYAGDLEYEKAGDSYWKELASFYSKLSKDKILKIKQSHELIRTGYKLYSEGKYKEAVETFISSKEILNKTGNVWEAKLCDYWIGSSLFYSNQIDQSTDIYKELAKYSEDNKFKWLASHSYSRLIYDAEVGNKKSKAIEYAEKGLEFAEEINDFYNLRRGYSQLAELYRQIGRYNESIKYLQKSLKIASFPESSLSHNWIDYTSASKTFYLIEFNNSSIVFETEALKLAKTLKRKDYEHLSNVNVGMIYVSSLEYEKAQGFIERSIDVAKSLPNKTVRDKALAKSKLTLAHIKRLSGNFDEAEKYYNETLDFYNKSEFQLYLYEGHKGLLLTHFAKKDDVAFQKELPIVLAIFEKYRSEILEEQNRNSFFNNEQDIYDIAIEYNFDKNNYYKAINYSEESRSRSLLDLINKGGKILNSGTKPEIKFLPDISEPLDIKDIQPQISEQVQIVQYAVLKAKIVIWVITKDNFDVAKTEISIETLNKEIALYTGLISRNNLENADKERQLATSLYQKLISPIEKKLDPNKIISFIPDKSLFELPFASLISPHTKDYLVKDYKTVTSPSLNIFLISSKNARKYDQQTTETLLSIGNPTFSRNDFDLPNLDSAKIEANEITPFYKDSVKLIGEDASKENVLNSFPKANIIHFAGHYVVDKTSPLLSSLVLAKKLKSSNKENSVLTNYEIIDRKLPKTKLIILSACQTGVEKFYKGEGLIGASRTFLAMGVPIVIASQWEVDSVATTELMINFHRYRKIENLTTIESLHRSQLDMLKNKEFQHPYYWASFSIYGGFAEF